MEYNVLFGYKLQSKQCWENIAVKVNLHRDHIFKLYLNDKRTCKNFDGTQ